MLNHYSNIVFAAISCAAVILQINDSITDLFNLEKISTVGILLAAVWYFKTELSKAKKEFDTALREKDALINELHKQILDLLKEQKKVQ